jgi:hypothetical protein
MYDYLVQFAITPLSIIRGTIHIAKSLHKERKKFLFFRRQLPSSNALCESGNFIEINMPTKFTTRKIAPLDKEYHKLRNPNR